ncbi:L,D-transpeptidase [Paenochrobactrum sp. BZR 588]|uniref:L,D-transpeptidase n=1 Tax=unclassified Paenochrobactrum TaxID=2639760 RepID=UPI003852FCBD
MSAYLSRRSFLTALGATAAASLAGCAQLSKNIPIIDVDNFGRPVGAPKANIDSYNGSYTSMYAAVQDEGYSLPAIPIQKMDKKYLRQAVNDPTGERPGTIVVDTANRFLYLVMENGQALRYGVGIGKDGFAWSGRAVIQWKRKWPRWTPPDEMIARQPHLEKYSARNGGMEPGLNNPLGARALYIFKDGKDTLYRLHGNPEWWSIGKAVSSGCVRMLNQDVMDLYDRVPNKTPILVM